MAETTIQTIADELNVAPRQVEAAAALLDDENTIPFIARYRKEVTGGLDEEQLRAIAQRLAYLRQLAERKETVLRSIEAQGKLTPELQAAIEAATTLQQVEDLYRPYKPKRRTRATVARERGLEPLAGLILAQPTDVEDLEAMVQPFLSDEVPTLKDAFAGARDIVAEVVTDDAEIRELARALARREDSYLGSTVADESKDKRGVYRHYYGFAAQARTLKPHQVLAINRGEKEGVLKVSLDAPAEETVALIAEKYRPNRASPLADDLWEAIEDGYARLLSPAVERDIRRELRETADGHAIGVFATNLKALLLQPPLREMTVMGIDPGYRTGCKVALVDPTGKYLADTTIYPHKPQQKWEQAKETLRAMIERGGVDVIAIGNGTASRETEQLIAEVIAALKPLDEKAKPRYVIVNEAGASVYSASKLARQEFPDLDVSMRGAISIARRLQDPLAELVKIDPKSIGVGLYQHDVDQKALSEALDAVVESAVNAVGVDVNTASPALLRHVSGIGPRAATALVKRRDEEGPFRSRSELLKVAGIGPKSFEQAAGFLRIRAADEPLDNTPIHPESYPIVRALFDLMGVKGDEPDGSTHLPWRAVPGELAEILPAQVVALRQEQSLAELAELLDAGQPTTADILDALVRPGRDPRDDLPKPLLRSDVLKMEDLKPGMHLKGTVRNVVDFGAFVDIGVKQEGLVHISRMADRYVKNPYSIVAVGDVVDVTVIEVDLERGRIALSMRRD
jgi:uncharacterized protein